jgi:hypothetical protein
VERFFAPDVEYMVNGTLCPTRPGCRRRYPLSVTLHFRGSEFIAGDRRSRNFSFTCITIWRSLHLARVR